MSYDSELVDDGSYSLSQDCTRVELAKLRLRGWRRHHRLGSRTTSGDLRSIDATTGWRVCWAIDHRRAASIATLDARFAGYSRCSAMASSSSRVMRARRRSATRSNAERVRGDVAFQFLRSRSNAPSPTTSTARRRGWMRWWRRRSGCSGCWPRSAGRSSPAPSPAASTPAPPSATPASPGSARFRRIGRSARAEVATSRALHTEPMKLRWRTTPHVSLSSSG